MSYETENAKFLEEVPSWNDDAVREKERVEMAGWLESKKKFSQNDIASLSSGTVTAGLYKDWQQSIADARQAEEDALQAKLNNPKLSTKSKIDILLEDAYAPKPTTLRERLSKAKRNPSHNHPKRSESNRRDAINKLLEDR